MLEQHQIEGDTSTPLELDLGVGRVVAFLRRSPERPQRNEDSLGVWQIGPQHVVLAVADGMGGAPAGGAASRLVMRSLDVVLRQQVESIAANGTARAALMDGIELASGQIQEMGVGAASTVVLAEICASGDGALTVRCTHVGDSQLVHCGQRGVVRFRSISDSPVGYAVEAGVLDEDAALTHADRHLVSNVVGTPDMQIHVGPRLPFRPRDTVVLASDGLWDNLAVDDVVSHVRAGPLPRVGQHLVQAVTRAMSGHGSAPGKPDDLAFLVFRRSR